MNGPTLRINKVEAQLARREVEGRIGRIMAFWVYILRCADGSYYTGHTDNLEQRMAQHQSGEIVGYTHSRRPVELMFAQECASRDEVLQAEQQLKGWGRKKKEAMARGDWKTVKLLARGKHRHQR